jgi:hypothetical protein
MNQCVIFWQNLSSGENYFFRAYFAGVSFMMGEATK